MRIDLKGDDELIRKLSGIKNLDFARKTVRKHGGNLQRTMKKNATPGLIFTQGYSRGETKRSISLEVFDSGLSVRVFPNTNYAPYLEYGTRKMEAEPFVKPSLDKVKDGFLKDLEKMDDGAGNL